MHISSSVSERKQPTRIQQVRDRRALSECKYGNSEAGLLFVFTDFIFLKRENLPAVLLLKL